MISETCDISRMKIFDRIFVVCVLASKPVGILAELKLSPPWITVLQKVNENYIVKCEGEGEKVWKHDNGQINSDRTGPSVTAVKKQHENAVYLRFNKIQKEFKGIYNCSATVKGQKYVKGFELIVIQPVTFVNTSTEVMIYDEGDEIMLDCDTEGEPTPIISWFFNNELIPETNAQILRNYSLKIMNASWKNSGIYICRAFQKILQTRDAELTYNVKVRHKPISFTGQLESTMYGFRNESRNMTCQVYAYPVAYFIWYRNNIPMDPRKNHIKIYNEENISILEVSLMDLKVLGNYSCEAANSLGYLIQTINVQWISKPISPKLLVFEYSDVFAMISVVIEPYPTYDFTCHIDCTEYTYCSYEEKWKRGISLECKNDRIKGTNKTHCIIDHLKPLTKYALRASIINNGGSGNFSEELTFRTRKDKQILHLNFLSSSATIAECSYFLFSWFFILTLVELGNCPK